MNSTIDESKEYIVGGGTILLPNKDKILEMPEKEARDFGVGGLTSNFQPLTSKQESEKQKC